MSLANLEAHTMKKNNHMKVTPCMIMVDNSYSVFPSMEQVNQSMREMLRTIKEEPVWANSIDLAIYSFNQGLDEEMPVLEFTRVLDLGQSRIESLYVMGSRFCTSLGECLERAVEILQERKMEYQANWIHTNMPNLIILSDFQPYGEEQKVTRRGIQAVLDKVMREHWKCIPVGVGEQVNEEIMRELMRYQKDENAPLIRFAGEDPILNVILAFQFVSSQVIQSCQNLMEERSFQDVLQDVENRKRGLDFVKKNRR